MHVCVCVCMHWCVCSRLSWYLGAVLRAILHLLSERSQEQGGDGPWQPDSFWALVVQALHAVRTWRGERLHERQSGPEFAKTFVVFPRKDQTQSDVSLLRVRRTRTRPCSYIRICALLFLSHVLSCQSRGCHSWEPSVFPCFCWCNPHFRVRLNGKIIYLESGVMNLILFLFQNCHQNVLWEWFLCRTSYTVCIRFGSLPNTTAYCDGPAALDLLVPPCYFLFVLL